MTNSERIRAMNDDELSRKLCSLQKAYGYCLGYRYCNAYTPGEGNGILKWLKESAKDVTDNSRGNYAR